MVNKISYTSRVGVPVEGISSGYAISMKYMKMILIKNLSLSAWVEYDYRIANTSCMHAHTHEHTHAHTRTHSPTTIAVQVVAARWVGAPNHDKLNAPFSPVPLAMYGRSVLHSNKQSCMRCDIRDTFGCFSSTKNF